MIYDSAAKIEIAIAYWFGYRLNLIVPNISWGMNIHECDLLVLTKANYASEVEIKVTKADLIKDKDKRHQHKSPLVRRLYFAIPKKLEKHIEHIPEHAGILLINNSEHDFCSAYDCKLLRPAKVNTKAKPLQTWQRYEMARLGALRIWKLKGYLITLKHTLAEERRTINELHRHVEDLASRQDGQLRDQTLQAHRTTGENGNDNADDARSRL